jgi:signal peptidase II
VKSPGNHVYWLLIPVAVIVFIDELFKKKGLATLPDESYLVNPSWLELVIHKNYGIAFDIPFRLWIIVAISLVIGYVLLDIAWKNLRTAPNISFSAIMIVIGAMGNLFDRIVYGFTVDYILLFGRSAINISDLMIVLGVIFLLMSSRKKKGSTHDAVHEHHDHVSHS